MFLSGCLSVSLRGYILGLWQRSLPFSSNWLAPLSPYMLGNWTCNPNPRIPIIALSSSLCIPHTSHPSVSLSMDPSLTTGSKGIYNLALSKHIAAEAACLSHNTKYQYEMDFYVQYIASNISFHYLNPWRQRAASPSAVRGECSNSFWGSPTRIIHKGFNIKIFCSALALNNSCLAFVFIGIGSRGVIRHYREPWFN